LASASCSVLRPRVRAISSRAVASSALARASSILRQQSRVLDRDGGLVGEGSERGDLLLEPRAGPETCLDVERAYGRTYRRRSAYRHARDGLDHQLMDAQRLRQARVVAGADGDDGLVGLHHALGDRPGEARVGLVASSPRASGMGLELPAVSEKQHKPSLGAEESHRVVGHPLKEPLDVVLTRQLPGDLEDAREPLLAREAAEHRGRTGRSA
jgi:hypothetical protein